VTTGKGNFFAECYLEHSAKAPSPLPQRRDGCFSLQSTDRHSAKIKSTRQRNRCCCTVRRALFAEYFSGRHSAKRSILVVMNQCCLLLFFNGKKFCVLAVRLSFFAVYPYLLVVRGIILYVLPDAEKKVNLVNLVFHFVKWLNGILACAPQLTMTFGRNHCI
jgi:hypothetical protein